jgi:hypothetical protein
MIVNYREPPDGDKAPVCLSNFAMFPLDVGAGKG